MLYNLHLCNCMLIKLQLFHCILLPTPVALPGVIFYDNNCYMKTVIGKVNDTHFKDCALLVDIFHMKWNRSTKNLMTTVIDSATLPCSHCSSSIINGGSIPLQLKSQMYGLEAFSPLCERCVLSGTTFFLMRWCSDATTQLLLTFLGAMPICT